MPTTCQINFDNNLKKIFFAGQKLHITVRLKLTDEKIVRGISIHLRGTAHVRCFTKDEDVLDMTKCLAGDNGELHVMPVGTYDYSFTCTLPRNLPSSFSGSYGHIKYSAIVVLRVKNYWSEKKFYENFDVLKPVNLNDTPSLRTEVSHQTSNEDEGMGFVSISAHMPATGYAYGQNINLQVSVNNTTDCPIHHFTIYLLRQTIYLKAANSEHRKVENTIAQRRIVSWKCGRQQFKTFPMVSIKVPAMIPPTDTETCNIIKVEYLVSIIAKGSDTRESQRVSTSLDLPITIGTIPFWENASDTRTRVAPSAPPFAITVDIPPLEHIPIEPSAPTFPDDDTVSVRTYTSTPPPFPDDDAGLPSYEEALGLDQAIDISLQSIEDSFSKLYNASTSK